MTTLNFSNTGADQSWVVPTGVTSVTVTANGAGGSNASSANGGAGGQAVCTVTTTPGETLTVVVGSSGSNGGGSGGYGGGGAGSGAGGGGLSGLFRGGTYGTGTPLCVAGGGGGGPYDATNGGHGGAGGGTTGSAGTSNQYGTGGGGGTQAAGGSGGVGWNTGGNGSPYAGGYGASGPYNGGGGGGGYFGGGGGGSGNTDPRQTGGGGGGSSYTTGTGTSTTVGGGAASATAGTLTLVYTAAQTPNQPSITAPATGSLQSTLTPGITVTGTDPAGQNLTFTVQLSTVSNFASIAYTGTSGSQASGSSYTYTPPALTPGTVYYARAYSTNTVPLQSINSGTVSFTPDQAPNAPTALSPSGSTSTYNTGFTASWTNNFSCSPQTQGSYAFKRVSTAYGTQWWNGSAWVGSEVFVTSSTASVVFPSGQWLGSAAYTWSVRIADSQGLAGPYSSTVTITSDSTPLAPTLVSPVNNGYANLGGGFTSTWTYNSGDAINDAQGSYAFRMKISGAGAYSYWNAVTQVFQSTLVWNNSTSQSVTFPAAAFTNGNVYNYSVATGDTLGTQGPFAADFVTTATTPPTVTVTAPNGVASDQQPYVVWTPTPAASQSYTGYRVVVESGGVYGTSPGTGVTAYDSGVVSTSTVVQQQITSSLINGTAYRVFVQVTQTGGVTSTWSTLNFTVTLDAPAAPVVTATMDVTNYRVAVTVQGRDNALSANAASIETDTSAWAAGTNTTAARSTAQSRDGSASMSLTATAGGAISASTASGTAGIRVN